jgi:enoyl-CoA hydratase/carnithine racemase
MSLVSLDFPFDRVALIRLQDGKSNALSKSLITELNTHLNTCDADPQIRCLVLTGNDQVFSAGAHLKELSQVAAHSFFQNDFIEPWQQLSRFSKPIIVAVSGHVLGGGFELALMGDIIIANETAIFGFPEITLDLLPGGGGTQRLARRLGASKALELCLTGKRIAAKEALTLGIVNHVTYEYLDDALQMAKKMSTFSLHSLQAIKKSIVEGMNLPFYEGMALERKLFHHLLTVGQYKNKIENFFKS